MAPPSQLAVWPEISRPHRGATRTDTAIYNTITQAVATMQSRPSGTGLYVVGNATGGAGCNAGAMLQQFPAGQFSDTAVTNIVPTALVGSCGDPDYLGNLSLGPLGSGQLEGNAVEIPNPNQIILPGGEIDATMTGRTLRGTVTHATRVRITVERTRERRKRDTARGRRGTVAATRREPAGDKRCWNPRRPAQVPRAGRARPCLANAAALSPVETGRVGDGPARAAPDPAPQTVIAIPR